MSQITKNARHRWVFDTTLFKMLKARWTAFGIFAAVSVLSILGIEFLLPPNTDQPALGLLSKKVDYLCAHHDDYNVLLVGTSMLYRAIDPALLKQVAQRNGCDVRAFNLGISQLRLTELRYIKNQLPVEVIGDYDLIVLSPLATSGIKVENWPSNRVQHFSDWEGYKSSLIDLWEYPETKTRSLYYSALLSGSFIYRQLGIGRLTNRLQGWPGSLSDSTTGDVFDGSAIVDLSRDGFVPLDDEPHEYFKIRRQKILNNGDHFENLKTSGPDIAHFEGPRAERAWRRYQRSMEYFADLNAPILMFLLPMVGRSTQDQALADHAKSLEMPLLNYNRIDHYPSFFDRSKWFDFRHTNQAGATAVTEQLGNDICSFMKHQGS